MINNKVKFVMVSPNNQMLQFIYFGLKSHTRIKDCLPEISAFFSKQIKPYQFNWSEAVFVDCSVSLKKNKFREKTLKKEIERDAELGPVFQKKDGWEHNIKIRIMPLRLRAGVSAHLGEFKKHFQNITIRQNLEFIIEYFEAYVRTDQPYYRPKLYYKTVNQKLQLIKTVPSVNLFQNIKKNQQNEEEAKMDALIRIGKLALEIKKDRNYSTQLFYLNFNYFEPLEIYIGEEKNYEESIQSMKKLMFSHFRQIIKVSKGK